MKQLPDNFYRFPRDATVTVTRKDLHELLLNTEGFAFAQGRQFEIVSKHLGAGVYRVSLKDRYKGSVREPPA